MFFLYPEYNMLFGVKFMLAIPTSGLATAIVNELLIPDPTTGLSNVNDADTRADGSDTESDRKDQS
jgi:hypothetical protein